MAVSGDLAIVGADLEDTGAPNGGAAYEFQRDEGGANNWGEVKKFIASNPRIEATFGSRVALSGETAIVGAEKQNFTGNDSGLAYVFQNKLPEPGDTDGDGCSDQRENGPDETLGGLRDYTNPYDFYDVLGSGGGPPDQVIDLPNDILGVIEHFSPQGAPPYDVAFDRGPSAGPNPWNMTAPDGVIDLPNDILGVILQFNHDCR